MAMNVQEIPTIDLRPANDGGLESGMHEWQELSKNVIDACQNYGCFRVLYDQKPSEVYEEIVSIGKYIFELPIEMKRKHVHKKPYYGYIEAHPRFPLCESMSITGVPELKPIQSFVDLIWPEGNPKALETLKSFYDELATLDLIIRKMILEGLGVGSLYDSMVKRSSGFGTLTRYSTPILGEKVMGLGGHTDKDFLTLIFQDEIGGLEFKPKDGPWIPIPPCPNSFIAIVGDCFKVWSNDRLEHAKHRVVLNEDKERFSFSFFSIPNDGVLVTIPDELVDSNHPRVFRPFDYKDYMTHCTPAEEEIKPTLYAYAGI